MLVSKQNAQSVRSRNLKNSIGPAVTTAIIVLLPVVVAWGQSTDSGTSPAQFARPATQPGANGTASIGTASFNPAAAATNPAIAQATFTAQPLPETPSAPQSILLPASPNQETFTEIQSDAPIGGQTLEVQDDGREAIGTFATAAPDNFQSTSSARSFNEPSVGASFQQPTGPSYQPDSANSNPSLPPISENGLRGTGPDNGAGETLNPQVNPAAFSNSLNFPNTTGAADSSAGFSTQQPQPPRPTTQIQSATSLMPDDDSHGRPEAASGDPVRRLPSRMFNAQPVDRSAQIDSQVRPTGFTQPATQPLENDDLELALELMDRYSVDRAPEPLPGRPVRLAEILQTPMPSNQRTRMINEYWTTYYDWSTLLSRAEYLRWLNSLSATMPTDQALLTAARSAAADQLLAAEIQLGKSQATMLDFIPARQDGLLPLPADQPLIQKYRTNYALYESNGMIPTRLRGIDKILPKTLELIHKRATTVNLAKQAADNARNALASRQTDIAYVLDAARLWRGAEQDLIASVISYNQAIADYSMTITRGTQSADQIVKMLIAKPTAGSSAVASENLSSQQRPGQFSAQGSFPGNQNSPRLQGARPMSQPGGVVNGQGSFDRRPATTEQGFVPGQSNLSPTSRLSQTPDRSSLNPTNPFQPNSSSPPASNPFQGGPTPPGDSTSQFSAGGNRFSQPNTGGNFGGSSQPSGTPRTANAQSGQFNNEFGR